ncbi:MAG: TonB-dependent receptor [Dysgonamonadaceae bacterium]|nr:TonB-dependent receptor [Dysgonamonadaceae bacterium]
MKIFFIQKVLSAKKGHKKVYTIMKLSGILLFIATFQGLANGYSQTVSLNLRLNNVPMREVFKEIENQSELSFLFSDDLSDLNGKVDVNVNKKNVREVLDDMFANTNLGYRILDEKLIVIAPKDVMQQRTITGVAKDEFGVVLPGVNVSVKGTSIGATTDGNGKYTVDIPGRGAVLVFSYIGYKQVEILVENQTDISVAMVEDVFLMDEVVVTGYGTGIRKASLTGAISTLAQDDLVRSSAVTTSGALVGKIAGLNTRQPDGRPGSTTMINIRNMGTPLYVIDGVQQNEGQFNNIDYNDIESLTVLKDASAAVYGLQAANGVIVVTTKKGKLKTVNTVSINAHYGWQKMLEYPVPADAETYVRGYIQSDVITGSKPRFTMEDLTKWKQGTEKGYVPFDWYDYIFKTGPQYYIGANVSGGSDKINYYVGLSNTTQESVIQNYGNFNRTNVQISVESRITDKFKIGATMNGRIEGKENPAVPGDDIKAPFLAAYKNLPTVRPYANDNPNYPALTSSSGDTNFAILNYKISGRSEEKFRVGQLNFDAEYEVLEGLKLKGLFSYFLSQKYANIQEYTYKLYSYDEKTDTYPVAFSMNNPFRTRNVYMKEEIKTQVQLTYDRKINLHEINSVLSGETFKRINPEFNIHAIPASNSIHLIDYTAIDAFSDYGDRTEARIGYIGKVNYNYAQKYLLEVAARYDGSWKFPPGDRWGFFPSASIGWRISEEKFCSDSKIAPVFSSLKLRASYGLLGDDNVSGYSAFDYMSGYNYNKTGAVINGEYYTGAEAKGLPVVSISWLRAKILDVGMDIGFFKNKLYGSLDYFNRMRTGLPAARYDVQIPTEAGFSLPNENINSDMQRGMDGSLIWNDKAGTFQYSIGGNFTYSRLYDWHQYKPRFGNSWDKYRNSQNERYNSINWAYEAIGQFQSWEEIANYPIDNDRQGNKTIRPGDIQYKDVNGDKIINSMDLRPVGYREEALPLLNYGLNFALQWNHFDLAFDFTGSAYATWTQDRELRVPFLNGGNSPQYTLGNQWMLSDIAYPDSPLVPGKYPTMIAGNNSHSNYWNSTFWRKNVHYIKLRNLEFGYNVPSNLLKSVKMRELRVYLSGQNLFYLTNIEGIDPEITSASGVQYPTTRVVNLGVKLKF